MHFIDENVTCPETQNGLMTGLGWSLDPVILVK